MDLTGNRLTGTIPADPSVPSSFSDFLLTGLTESAAMRRLSLATNLLVGTIPAGLWRFRLQARLTTQHVWLPLVQHLCLELCTVPSASHILHINAGLTAC